MSIIRVMRSVVGHPLNQNAKLPALMKFFRWQLSSRIMPYPVIVPFAGKCKLIAKKGTYCATGNYYCGLFEFEEMGFVLHFLQDGDLFVDVGANVGSYSILAAGERNTKCMAFEPSPSAYNLLVQNIAINGLGGLVTPWNRGVGKEVGKLKFTEGLDTVNHIAVEGEKNVVEVDIISLDSVLEGLQPVLLKIDVEGFESEVIKGCTQTVAKPSLKAILIELKGHGSRYGFDEKEIHLFLLNAGFLPYRYDPFKRSFRALSDFGGDNTIYLRDLPLSESRVKAAVPVKIGRHML